MERWQDGVVYGEIDRALDMCRHIFMDNMESNINRREEAAHLLLERLRSNSNDGVDQVNAILRLLANSITPTKSFTEELLSLLFFSEHCVLIIHHVSQLTYQSRPCVKLVVQVYMELLTSDRTLLVPILGSLADLPLQSNDKLLIVEATESLLEAAKEEDVPAVIHTLLTLSSTSTTTIARIVPRIRMQCNRLVRDHASTLALSFEVILRHATIGSIVLRAYIHSIRQVENVTVFEVIFLSLLMHQAAENTVAIQTCTQLVHKAQLSRRIIKEAVTAAYKVQWSTAMNALVRFASAVLSSCLQPRLSTRVHSLIPCAIDCLGLLVKYRTPAHEEGLRLLLALVSQPQRLVLNITSTSSVGMTIVYEMAHIVAAQLAAIATDPTTVHSLVPFAHLFLDQLHSMVSTSSSRGYPPSILQSLCHIVVLLTKAEPSSMLSLLMMTIQKQLVVVYGIETRGERSTPQLSQLMAMFLASYLLTEDVVSSKDRHSLVHWLLKLLSSPTSDITLVHLLQLLCTSVLPTISVEERETCHRLLTLVFQKKGFEWKHDSKESSSIVLNIASYVEKTRLGKPLPTWSPTSEEHHVKSILGLLIALFQASLHFAPDSLKEKAFECGFVLVLEEESGQRPMEQLWCMVCALRLAIESVNTMFREHKKMPHDIKGLVRLRKRLILRIETCWSLEMNRKRALVQFREAHKNLDEWTTFQLSLLERYDVIGSMQGLSLEVIIAVFGGFWKLQVHPVDLALEVELLRVLGIHFQGQYQDLEHEPNISISAMKTLVSTPDGRRTLKHMARRLCELLELVHAWDDQSREQYNTDDEALGEPNREERELYGAGIDAITSVVRIVLRESARHWNEEQDGELDQMYSREKIVSLLVRGAVKTKSTVHSTPSIECEKLYQTFVHAAINTTDPDVMCVLLDLLLGLVAGTQMQYQLSRLCLALLHYPFPPITCAFTSFSTPLPFSTLSSQVISPRGHCTLEMFQTNLSKHKKPTYYLSFLLVGAWSISPTVHTALQHVVYLLDAMETLISSSSIQKHPQNQQEEEYIEAGDGEHCILKNLTNTTLSLFYDSLLVCVVATPLRVLTHFDMTPSHPFLPVKQIFNVLSYTFNLFYQAEMAGFNLPTNTSIAVLRAGPYVTRHVRQLLDKCMTWRLEPKRSEATAAVHHLEQVIVAARSVVTALERVSSTYQDKMVLKMQHTMQSTTRKNGWDNELLRKTLGSKKRRRRALTTSEAKLLPYFGHAVTTLHGFLVDQSSIYHIEEMEDEGNELESLRMNGDDVDDLMEMLEDAKESVDFKSMDKHVVALAWKVLNEQVEEEVIEEDEKSEESEIESE